MVASPTAGRAGGDTARASGMYETTVPAPGNGTRESTVADGTTSLQGRKTIAKPSSVASVHLSWAAVARGLMRPTRGSCGVGPTPAPLRGLTPYSALLRAGFGQPVCRHTAGALLPHHFTLALLRQGYAGRCVSVPLSVGSPRLGVTQPPALPSSHFPPPLARERTPGTLRSYCIIVVHSVTVRTIRQSPDTRNWSH